MADTLNHNQNRNEVEVEEEEEQRNDRVMTAGGDLSSSDLIYDILRRLPVKSVGRFRCVSKDWKTLLSNPKFLNDQFSFNNHQTKIILLRDYNFVSIEFRNDCNNKGRPVGVYETLTFRTSNRKYDIHGSCNGLILLDDFETSQLSIVNPITHELRQLPSVPQSVVYGFSIFGFGYCLKDDEFTVIIVSDRTLSSPVYMLKNNLWKRVGDSPPLVLYGCGTFVDDSIHWLGYRVVDNSYVICAFDLASERFREVEYPEVLNVYGFRLDVLGGCLALVLLGNSTNDIWVMKKYGLRGSWTKYTAYMSRNGDVLQPLFFWNGDESIVAASEGRLIFCCLKQKTSLLIPIIGEQSPEFNLGGKWTFVDSLFSPNSSSALEGPNQVQV